MELECGLKVTYLELFFNLSAFNSLRNDHIVTALSWNGNALPDYTTYVECIARSLSMFIPPLLPSFVLYSPI